MGFWDFLRKPSRDTGSFLFTPNVEYLGGQDLSELWTQVNGMSPAEMFRTQPHLRTVVSFLGRNVAQLGLHSFERVSDTDRRRDHGSPIAKALRAPDTNMTTYELVFALVVDMALYDVAYWYVGASNSVPGGTMLRRLPPAWVSPVMANAFDVDFYRVSINGKMTEIPPANVLAFNGFSPSKASGHSPTIGALKATLFEQVEAAKYRNQVWSQGGRVSSVLERPAEAPQWSDGARESFREDWYAKYTGNGPKAGGTPILEDGMKLTRVDFNAQEQQYVEGAKLALATVAAAFHVNPTMVGQLENANYSNVREFRRMLYGDTLGPMLAQIEARLNTFLLPMLGMDPVKFYVEFNIAEKLQGSFEEQAAVMSTLVGAPIMNRNEGRAKFNLSSIAGGDELVTPLNVLIGGHSSPQDGETAKAMVVALKAMSDTAEGSKARAPETYEDKAQQVLEAFFDRQSRSVLSALGVKAEAAWWDQAKWDKELSDDLYALAISTAKQVSAETLKSIGFDAGEYDEARTYKFLRAVSDSRAGAINATTKDQIDEALASADEAKTPSHVFEEAKGSRSSAAAVTLVTTFSAFATTEAAKQAAGDKATKTWLVTSSNPRPAHSAMGGETVSVNKTFSNGADWPGDPVLGADGVAGCTCGVQISVT